MKGFPEDIMPDGESGIFSAAVHCKNTAGLEIPLIPPKATLAVTKSRPVRPDVCSQMVWIPVVISKSPIRAGFKITGPGRGSLKRYRDKMENSMI